MAASKGKAEEPMRLPRHIAIIMDGNGRWAEKRFLPRVAGHKAGVDSVRAAVTTCGEQGVEALTLFAFSSENWLRPQEEVSLLMELFLTALEKEVKKLHKNNVRLSIVGELSRFNDKLRQRIREAEALTAGNTGLRLNIAANYGGQWDIVQATQKLAVRVAAGELEPAAITPALLEAELCLRDMPSPDLFIRTGGEHRISNFLLWQLAYTELYFSEVLWPDFNAEQLKKAIADFGRRERRFGKTGAQVRAETAGAR